MNKSILVFTGMFYATLFIFAAPVIIVFRKVADRLNVGGG